MGDAMGRPEGRAMTCIYCDEGATTWRPDVSAYVCRDHRAPDVLHLVEQLDVALHGRTVARTESPEQVWNDLLGEVSRLVNVAEAAERVQLDDDAHAALDQLTDALEGTPCTHETVHTFSYSGGRRVDACRRCRRALRRWTEEPSPDPRYQLREDEPGGPSCFVVDTYPDARTVVAFCDHIHDGQLVAHALNVADRCPHGLLIDDLEDRIEALKSERDELVAVAEGVDAECGVTHADLENLLGRLREVVR